MNYYSSVGFGSYSGFGFFGPFFVVILFWSLYWKGRALWLAARKGSLYWFIALLVINTMGILEISYIYYFSKKDNCCGGNKNEDKKEGVGCSEERCNELKNEKTEGSCACEHEHK